MSKSNIFADTRKTTWLEGFRGYFYSIRASSAFSMCKASTADMSLYRTRFPFFKRHENVLKNSYLSAQYFTHLAFFTDFPRYTAMAVRRFSYLNVK